MTPTRRADEPPASGKSRFLTPAAPPSAPLDRHFHDLDERDLVEGPPDALALLLAPVLASFIPPRPPGVVALLMPARAPAPELGGGRRQALLDQPGEDVVGRPAGEGVERRVGVAVLEGVGFLSFFPREPGGEGDRLL